MGYVNRTAPQTSQYEPGVVKLREVEELTLLGASRDMGLDGLCQLHSSSFTSSAASSSKLWPGVSKNHDFSTNFS